MFVRALFAGQMSTKKISTQWSGNKEAFVAIAVISRAMQQASILEDICN